MNIQKEVGMFAEVNDFKKVNLDYYRGNIFKRGKYLCIIKISRTTPQFWGLNGNIISLVIHNNIDVGSIFLDSAKSGYFYTANNIRKLIDEKNIKPAHDKEFKINLPLRLDLYFKDKLQFDKLYEQYL